MRPTFLKGHNAQCSAPRVPTQMISPPSARPPPFDRGKPRQVGEVCRRNAPLLTSLHFTASQREKTVKSPHHQEDTMWSARVIWLPRELCLKLLWEATPARPLMPGLYPQCFLRFTWTPVWWLFFPQVDGCKYGNSVGVREAHLTQRSDPLSSPKREGGEEFRPPLLPPREKICVVLEIEGSRNPVLSPYPYALRPPIVCCHIYH
jgi:hypothetical protein